MNPEQAFNVIKQILDASVQKGIFSKLEDTNMALQALQVIANALKDDNKKVIHNINE